MKYITAGILTATISISNALASDTTLPTSLAEALQAAHASGNDYVITSVASTIKQQNPNHVAAVDSYLNALTNEQIAETETEAQEEEERNWEASAELGLAYETGNTEKENVYGKGEIEHEFDKWENTATFKVDTSKESDIRISEEYRFGNQTRYNLSEKDYVFGEIEYVNDRFSGYDYRISEYIGYGTPHHR